MIVVVCALTAGWVTIPHAISNASMVAPSRQAVRQIIGPPCLRVQGLLALALCGVGAPRYHCLRRRRAIGPSIPSPAGTRLHAARAAMHMALPTIRLQPDPEIEQCPAEQIPARLDLGCPFTTAGKPASIQPGQILFARAAVALGIPARLVLQERRKVTRPKLHRLCPDLCVNACDKTDPGRREPGHKAVFTLQHALPSSKHLILWTAPVDANC